MNASTWAKNLAAKTVNAAALSLVIRVPTNVPPAFPSPAVARANPIVTVAASRFVMTMILLVAFPLAQVIAQLMPIVVKDWFAMILAPANQHLAASLRHWSDTMAIWVASTMQMLFVKAWPMMLV